MRFIVIGEPQGKARPRVLRSGRAYTPRKTAEYERRVRAAFLAAGGIRFPEGVPLAVAITAQFAPPKSASRKRRQAMLDGAIFPTKKPDADNIAKAVLDALNGLCYRDDSAIVALSIEKRYADVPQVTVDVTIADQQRG